MTARDPVRQEETPQPWYRHPWVWLIIAIPGSSVLVGAFMITAALNTPGDLVQDDYYRAGVAINQDLSARRRAEELGLQAVLQNHGPDDLLLRVEAGPGVTVEAPGALLEAHLQHPTLADRDITLRMEPVANGRWAVALPRFEGTRTLEVTHPSAGWSLRQEVRAPAIASGAQPPAGGT